MAGKSKYYQVKEQIEDMLARGELQVGDELPSEPKLAEMFKYNRGTVRQALSILANDGIISRRSGFRTVIVRMPQEKAAHIISFARQIEADGLKPITRVLAQNKMFADEAGGRVCEAFALEAENAAKTEVYCIKRLRYGGEQPLALQTIYLLAKDFGADLLEKYDFIQSVFDLYTRYQRRVVWASESISARPADSEEVKLLGMGSVPKPQRFVYVRERISYDQNNLPLEVMTAIDRGDVFKAYRYRIVEEEHTLIRPTT